MKNKIHNEVTFKAYNQHQVSFLPPSLEVLLPEDHPVRTVNRIVDEIDISPLVAEYKSGGTSSYHPAMLLKILLYCYLENIYSTRKMEVAIRERIPLMWLAGDNRPDHNTLARFRSKRLKNAVNHIFKETVHLLADAGLILLKESFIDGTKIEANANRYTFVWGKSLSYNKKRIAKQLDELIDYASSVAKNEDKLGSITYDKISPDKVRETIEKINDRLHGKEVDPKVKQKLRYAEKNWPDSVERYEKQEEILGNRNSYSKTDTDATFMRMKDDHMMNGQLKPGYNLQASSENQFITNVTVHDSPTDPNTLKKHLQSFEENHGSLPDQITADAGYGSNENYSHLEENGVEGFVKYPGLHREEKGKLSKYHQDSLEYNEEENYFTCPAGKKMVHLDTVERKTSSGFVQIIDRYKAKGCRSCPLKNECHKGKNNRRIDVNHELRRQKKDVKKRLYSKEGIQKRKRRCWEIETFFGDIKQNRGFTRFNLRGMANVLTESLMMAMTYNIRKMPA